MYKFVKYILFLVFLLSLTSCYEDLTDAPIGNIAPDTGLFLYPDSTISQQPSRLRVSWWGDDPDGIIAGFYFKWEGIDTDWSFTTSNDSIFSLPIGTTDTTYNFLVSAADNFGNGTYDNQVQQNGINFGAEPFIDENENGVYDEGEKFYDIGLIDPTPASSLFPIKNTAPVVEWDELTVLPDSSFPVITIRWNASDLDGDESITSINIALNDTSNPVSLAGTVRLVTLRGINLDSGNPEMEILINGSDQNIASEKLTGLQLNSDNKIFIWAEDFSGAKAEVISLPDTSSTWYVKNPKGKLLIFDDFSSPSSNQQAKDFYVNTFNSLSGGALINNYDYYDLQNSPLPFESVTLLETMKLFDYIFWYSTSKPRLDLLNIVTNKFTQSGGKIAFSMTYEDSSGTFPFDLSAVQGFLPIDSISNPIGFLLAGANLNPVLQGENYPQLTTSSTVSFVRTFQPNEIIAERVYTLSSSQGSGNIGFRTTSKNLFFIGIPLHLANGNMNVNQLLEKIFIDDFGLMP